MKLKYPYYSEKNDLALVVVETIEGEPEYRVNCRRINGGYYVKGIHLKYVEGEWVLPKNLIYDHELKKEVESYTNLIKGIVSFKDNSDVPVFGYFSPNPYTNCVVQSQGFGTHKCIDYKILNPTYFKERYAGGYYVHITHLTLTGIKALSKKALVLNNNSSPYNIEDNQLVFKNIREVYKNSVFPIDYDIKLASRYLKDITFGAELETINGAMPQHILNKYGTVICKDGSIKSPENIYPPEYVTTILSGAKGVQTLRNLAKEISLRSDIDIKCSYHLHIGGLKIDRLFFVSMFKLCTKIQDDVFAMFPYYKTNPAGVKEKNYCKKLPPDLLSTYKRGNFNEYVNMTYADIFSFLSGGLHCDENFNRENRQNPWPEGKWNIKTRYYWVNFVNLLFSKRDTIEFRVHTPTLNSHKIINWLFICNAICKFAEKFPKLCITNKPVSFIDVLNYYSTTSSTLYASNLSRNLIEYYKQRRNVFEKDKMDGDIISEHDIIDDANYYFNALILK